MTTETTTETKFDTVLVCGSNGHVWVARTAIFDGTWVHLNHARIVRVWGTSKGLNELVNGPLKDTVLDAPADVVSLYHQALIAIIPSSDAQWAKHLS